jgi:tetratricopeptide (TPR) repeat protein
MRTIAIVLATALALLTFSGCTPTTRSTDAASLDPAALDPDDDQGAWTVDVGFLEFPNSGAEEAHDPFLRGVAFLHSFAYKQAIQQFQKAQGIDPDFALAYWGETFCYNHPLLPERDLESPRAVLARLGATPEERAAKAPTQREKDFLAASEVLFGEGDTAERRIAYKDAMAAMYQAYPDDDEVAAFYSLSLLAAIGPMKDDSYRLAMQAGAIAQQVFSHNPDHPGAAHYIIHAFDDPIHAPLALPAAYRFADIAAAASHARHMPSHIFIQLGMWERVSLSNDSAYQAALDLFEKGDAVSDMVHAVDWGHYGDLQWGNRAKAKQRRATLDKVIEMSDGAMRAVETEGLMWAREVVETEEWATREITDETSAPVALATGLSAIAKNDLALAKQAAERLRILSSGPSEDQSTFQRGTGPAQVAHREVAARIELSEGRTERALQLLDEGVQVAASMGPPRGSASPVKPVSELYGEVLLELGRPAEAAEKFEEQLLFTPNRPLSLRGLARAYREAGDMDKAREAYQALAKIWQEREGLPGLDEARTFLTGS